LLNWGDVNDLCDNCKADIEMAKEGRSVLVYDESKFDSREIRWHDVIAANPDRWEGYHQRGKHHCDTERYDEAVEDFNRVIVLDPDNALHYYHRGLIHMKLENTVEAVSDFEKAIEIDPEKTGLLAREQIGKLGHQNQ
jgi:tetratricopeptide (TPR) repeat protein